MRQCCKDLDSFLRPGRRQCVGARELPELLLGYVHQLWATYSHVGRAAAGAAGAATDSEGTPRMGLLNLMAAHEHFMHRLGGLDAILKGWLLQMEGHLRRDTALFLLSDHGTHGIWYNQFAVGQAEHRTPVLTLVLPAWWVRAHPTVDAALRRNTRRRVTAYDIHATLQHLADWPAMPPPTLQATSLFVDLPDGRRCASARVPAEFCLEWEAPC